jgi:hypothetical protein
MSIKIPSKNIYNIENPKVRDNFIDNVSVEQTVIKPNNEYETPVHNEKFLSFNLVSTNGDIDGKDKGIKTEYKYTRPGSTENLTVAFCSYCGYQDYEKTSFSLKIPRIEKNRFINSISYGEDKYGEPNIKYSVYCSKKTGNATGVFVYSVSDGFTDCVDIVLEEGELDDKKSYSIPEQAFYTYEGTNSITNISGSATAKSKFYKGQSIIEATPKYTENDVEINFDIIAKTTIIKLGTNPVVVASGRFQGSGTYEEYIPTQIEITIYGNTIGIDITNGSVKIESETGETIKTKPFSYSGNELIQDSATFNGEPLTKYLATNILNQYKNGKETAVVLCSISDYYDYEIPSIKPIDINGDKKMFEDGDIVVPMVRGVDGKDYPMSIYKNGEAKRFEVVGVKPFYDGAVWQELTLLEVSQ